jgi:hypothetical protein
VDIRITGTSELARVQHRLKLVGDTGLGKQMGKQLRAAVAEFAPAARKEALAAMPSGYGPTLSRSLNFRLRVRDTAYTSDVRIRVTGKGRKELRDVPRLNRGRLRHPLFGNRNRWYDQRVRPGFVDRPADRLLPDAAKRMQAVIDYVADQIGA